MTTSRRSFLKGSLATGLTASLASPACATSPFAKGTAEHCIFIWLGGGACHIDTWDPKRQGDPQTRKAGSAYGSIETAVAGTRVCEHLPRCAKLLDRCNIVRSIHHEGFPDHGAATNFVHTGRPTSGTVVYPSIGSLIAHCRGAIHERVPAYVLIGFPNVARGPGFLGARAGSVYLTDTRSGPRTLTREGGLGQVRQSRREQLLAGLRTDYLERQPRARSIRDYDQAIDEALRLSGPEFQGVFQLDQESDALRESYGGEFGQRCLLSRRLLQAGVRFVEVSHNLNFVNGSGWDTHRQGQLKQHLLIRELDVALAALIADLEAQKMLDKTLIAVATEFGRPAQFDGGGGRGHHFKSYSMVLAGGGLRNGITIGATDELGMELASPGVSIPDFHATIACALGIDPSRKLYAGDRPVPLTDHGRPIQELFG